MARAFPIGKPHFPGRLLPPLCLLLSLGIHALWGLAEFGTPYAPPDDPTAPRMVALPSTTFKEWTPVLFSLPSSSGFSSALGESREEVIPPLDSPLRLTGPAPMDSRSARAALPGEASPVEPPQWSPVTADSFPPEAAEPPAATGWRLTFPARPDLQVRFVRDARLPSPSRFLRVEGEIAFDRHGLPAFLVVDPPRERREWVEQVWPDLRETQLDAEDAPARVRFRLEYVPGGNGL